VSVERIDPDGLDGQQGLVFDIELSAARGLSEAKPVGSLVGGAAKALLLDEGFEQERPVTVLELPVGGDLPGGASQDGRGQIPAFNPRQDEESRIVHDPVQVLLALRRRPADIVVARLGLPGGGSEAEQGDEASASANEVAQLGTGQRLIAEVVVTVGVLVVQLRFGATTDPVQLQCPQGARAIGAEGCVGFGLCGTTVPGFAVVIPVAWRRQLQQAVGLHAQHHHAAAHLL